MKELGKNIFTWFLGLFNFEICMGDMGNAIDTLLIQLYAINLEQQANEIEHIYRTIQLIEATKCFIMFLTIAFVYIANQKAIEDAALWLWKKARNAVQFISKNLKKLFKFKQSN